MKRIWIGFLLMLTCSFALGAGGEWKPLRGKFTITSSPLSDPLPGGSPVAFFTIEGDAAKTIFSQMVEPQTKKNACAEKGMIMKTVGNVVCSKHGAIYTCNFGVGLSDGKPQPGYTC